LPAADGAQGLAIDATNAPVTFSHEGGTAGDGLVIQSPTGALVSHVTVRNIDFVGYNGAGLSICGGLISTFCVDANAENVKLDHVGSFGNTLYGVRIWAANLLLVN